MPISPYAVREWVGRKVENYDWMKKLTHDELDKELKYLGPIFITDPMKHQKVAFILGYFCPDFLFLLDMGTGKTKIMLDLIAFKQRRNESKVTLVCVPTNANVGDWSDEVDTHQPGLDYCGLVGSSDEKWEKWDENHTVYCISYHGLIALVTDLKMVTVRRRQVKKWVVNNLKIAKICDKIDSIVIDESTAIKNHASLTCEVVEKIAGRCDTRYALTGTPFGRDPHDLFTQFRVVDGGETLGRTLGLFRQAFFNTKKGWHGGYEHKFDKRKEKKLHRLLKNRSIWYEESECADLPQKVFRERKCSFSTDQSTYYQKILLAARNSENTRSLLFKNNFMKMRQISSGFLNHVDDDGRKFTIDFSENPKLEELLSIIEGMNPLRKMVIFYEFTYSGDKICKELKKLKYKHERLYSGTKDQAKALSNFKSDPSIRFFVVQNRVGTFGLNLQVANFVVFYESPVSPIIRKQAEKRCHRKGQERRVFYYDIVVRNSVDEKILRFLEEGKDLFDALVKGKEKL